MVHIFTLKLLQPLSRPAKYISFYSGASSSYSRWSAYPGVSRIACCFSRGSAELPGSRHRYYLDDLPPAPGVSKEVVWCVFCRPSFLLIVLATCYSAVYHSHTSPSADHSLTLDLVALPHSSTSPTLTQVSSTAPMLSIAN